MKVVVASVLAMAAAMFTLPAGAAVISYAEPPDLNGNTSTPTNLGALDIGTNTVSGRTSFSSDGTGRLDLDPDVFRVSLGSGLQITNISITVTNFTATNFTAGTNDGFGTTLPISFARAIAGDGSITIFSGAAAGAGTLQIATQISARDLFSEGAGSFNYTISMVVSPTPVGDVPEPGTLSLVGAGLVGLAMARRRRA